MSPARHVLGALVVLASVFACVLAGCGPERKIDGIEPIPPGAGATRVGVSASVWTVRDIDLAIARAFAQFGDPPSSINPGVVTLLRQNGFAVVEVPVERLGEIRSLLPEAGGTQQQWIDARPGVLASWSEIVLGPRVSAPIIETDAGVLELEPGRLRLLARAWSSGRIAEQRSDPAIRLELVVQHLLDRRERLSDLYPARSGPARSGPPWPVDGGVVFDRLLIDAELQADTALVLVPISAGEDWVELLADTSDFTGPDSGAEGVFAGPPAPRYPTLGEATLGVWAYARSPRPTRALVVLQPYPPARFGLLAR